MSDDATKKDATRKTGSSPAAPPRKPDPAPPDPPPKEHGGPAGPEPTRYGDWEKNGRCSDF